MLCQIIFDAIYDAEKDCLMEITMDILNLNNIKRADPYDSEDVKRELAETRELCRIYDEIIENNPDGIYVTDGDANAIRINPAFERISGLNRDEMLGVNHKELEKNNVVAKSSALMVVEQRKTVTIIHDYIKSGLQALVTSLMRMVIWN